MVKAANDTWWMFRYILKYGKVERAIMCACGGHPHLESSNKKAADFIENAVQSGYYKQINAVKVKLVEVDK